MMAIPTPFVLAVALAGGQASPPPTPAPSPTPRAAATITDVAWLAGSWQGEGLGGQVDEVWSEPAGGAMVGYFRLVKDGQPVFYEIMTLLEVEGGVELRLKHVNPDMTGWEEKDGFVRFPLLGLDSAAAHFKGLVFRRVAEDGLEVVLTLRSRTDGTVRDEVFRFRRVKGR